MARLTRLTVLCWLGIFATATAQTTGSLKAKIERIISTKQAVVGVSIIGNDGKDRISINGDKRLPLQSVFKSHIALAVLSEVDKGRLALNQPVTVQKHQLLPNLWSPLREANPNGGVFTVAQLIRYAIIESDNVACDVLIGLLGNAKAVEKYIRQSGIEAIQIAYTEEVMQAKWENMFQNWTTPKAASQMLSSFYNKANGLLSENSYDFFWTTMKETTTGKNRLKGLLPAGTVVAHKTGSSGTNAAGITAATNDIGIVFLPNGKHFVISVFVANSKENDATNERIIAEVAKAAYDYYSMNK